MKNAGFSALLESEDFERCCPEMVRMCVNHIRCEDYRGTNSDSNRGPKKNKTKQRTVMYKSNRKHRTLHAFTLLEIMLVVMIISILAAAAIHLLGTGSITTTRITVTRTNIQHARTVLIQYQILAGRMPTTEQGLDALINRPERDPKPRSWSQQSEHPLVDGWEKPLNYKNPGVRHPNSFDIYSSGPDGLPDTADDIWE